MLLVTHIIIAVAGLVATGLANFRPSRSKISTSYSLIGLTLATGSILVVKTHASLTSACLTGLIYLAVNLVGLASAERRLVSVKQPVNDK
jgi:hypothetical protein